MGAVRAVRALHEDRCTKERKGGSEGCQGFGGGQKIYTHQPSKELTVVGHIPLRARLEATVPSKMWPAVSGACGSLLATLWTHTQYGRLAPEKQRAVAAELDREPGEVLKKLEDIANSII